MAFLKVKKNIIALFVEWNSFLLQIKNELEQEKGNVLAINKELDAERANIDAVSTVTKKTRIGRILETHHYIALVLSFHFK